MIKRNSDCVFECVVVDMNTQADFCRRGGAHPVANYESLIPALRRVVAWTKRNGVPVVSSLDSHRLRDIQHSSHRPCCIDGSNGQSKIPFTILPRSALVEVDNTLSISMNLFSTFQQLLFRMRDDDLLSNPKADRFLTQLPTSEFVVVGNVLEQSVKTLVLGLLARHKAVSVIVDACGYWNKFVSELAQRQMVAKGATIMSVDELLVRVLTRRRRYRNFAPKGTNGNGHRTNGKQSAGKSDPISLSIDQLQSAVRAIRMSRKNGRERPGCP